MTVAAADSKARIYTRLKREFPEDTVDVTDSFRSSIHVLVISRRFDGFETIKDKQDFVWRLIEDAGLDEGEISRVSVVAALSPGEL